MVVGIIWIMLGLVNRYIYYKNEKSTYIQLIAYRCLCSGGIINLVCWIVNLFFNNIYISMFPILIIILIVVYMINMINKIEKSKDVMNKLTERDKND